MLKRHTCYLTLLTVMVSVVSKPSVKKIRSAFKAVDQLLRFTTENWNLLGSIWCQVSTLEIILVFLSYSLCISSPNMPPGDNRCYR